MAASSLELGQLKMMFRLPGENIFKKVKGLLPFEYLVTES